MSFWKSLKKWYTFNPEVFATKTFKNSAMALVGVFTAFGAGEIGWRSLCVSIIVFVVTLCIRDGFITTVKEVKAINDEDCASPPKVNK